MTSPLSAWAPDSGAELPAWLREGLQARVAAEIGLPVLPDTACRVMAACRDERSDLRELAELVTHDQSLATHVLRVANSVGFGAKVPVLSLRQALGRLGLSTVSDIAIAVAIKQRVFAVPGYEERVRQLWLHSAVTACYAQDLATLLQRNREAAFLCGLLHDVGMPVAMQAVCDLVRERKAAPVAPAVMESAMHEFHCAFGGRIAERWRLGPLVSAALHYHHRPLDAGHVRPDVLIVHLADELAYWAPDEAREAEDLGLDGQAFHDLGISPEAIHALVGSRGRVLELARAFQ